MSTDLGSTIVSSHWAWQWSVNADLMDNDPAAYEQWLRIAVESAHSAAAEQGYQLEGEPAITKTPSAMVETPEGSVMMPVDLARGQGYNVKPTWYVHLFEFRCRPNG